MALTAARATFRKAIKPVGEAIVLSSVDLTPVLIQDRYKVYDFIIDANFSLTKLLVTKTVASLPANTILTVRVLKITKGADADAVETLIAQVGFAASAVMGTTLIGGLLTTGATIGNNENTATTSQFINGTVADPLTRVLANTATDGASPSQQRVRIQIKAHGVGGAVTANMSCFIRCDFSRFNDVRNSGVEELITVKSSDA